MTAIRWMPWGLASPGLATLLMVLPASPLPSQERVRYDTTTVEQRVLLTGDLTPAQARRRGIEEALAEGVRQVSGVLLRSGVVAVREEQAGRLREEWRSVVQLDAAGRVTSYEVVDESWMTTRHPELGDQVYLRLVVRATVATELAPADAGFLLEVRASAATLIVRGRDPSRNDELVLHVRSTRDAHLAVLSVEDDSATLVFPNAWVRDVPVVAGDSMEIPAADWRARGLRLRARLPDGVASRREQVVVVATRDPVPPFSGGTVMDLQRWLVGIPPDRRAVQWVLVETRRR